MTHIRRLSTIAATLGAVLVGAPIYASAQSIVGSVTSAGAPVVGARVQLVELERATQSGAKGEFLFRDVAPGKYRVFVAATGYASATDTVVVADGAATASFDLHPAPVRIRPMVVSASPTARTTDEQYQSTDSKSRTDFMNSAGSSFAEKVSDLPGVSVRGNGSAPTRPILRGLGDNEVLVLENGLRIGDIATYDPAHATPLEAISVSQIDVVRGPATILYGPSTIGGLVNVITDIVPTVSDRRVSGTAAFEGNTVSNQSAGFINTVFSGEHQAFRVSAGGVHAGDIRIPAGTYTDPGSGMAFNLSRMPQTFDRSGEAGAGYTYQGDFGSIGIGAKHYEINYGIPGVPPNPDFATAPPTTSRIDQRRNTVEARSLFNVSGAPVKQIKLDASYNDYNHSEFPTAQDSSGVSDPRANHFHKRELNAVLQFRQQPIGKLDGTIGFWTNVEDLTIEGDQPLGPNSLTTGYAGYAYEEYAATSNTRLQAGVRFDYNKIQTRPNPESTDSVFRTLNTSRLSNAFTASLGAVQRLGAHTTASFSLARSFRAPTVQELFANGLDAASGTYSLGSAGLAPETGLGIDASLRGKFANVAFEVSPYVNYIDHYIYGFLRGDTIQAFPVRKFSATNARLAGAEGSVTVQPFAHFAMKASGDYVNAEDTEHGVPLPFIPPLRGLLRGTYQDNAYMAMAEWRVAASQTRLGDGDTPTPGYGILNLGVGLGAVDGTLVHNISFHIDNVFNRVYRDNLSVVKDFIPQPARAFRVNYELLY
ncbi:MAG: TonB-dependent receptor [Gemmatimonadota bacterium]|nr:TonB-dependent receptor [Gemmatimonadota bacterium]